MTLAFHQPNFLPNLSFFYKMARCDTFVIVSNLQFEKGEGWQRRHKIRSVGKDIWLTVPVKGSQNQLIRDVQVNTSFDWRRKQARALQLTYAKTAEREVLDRLLALYDTEYQRLVDVNVAFIRLLQDVLGISAELVVDEEVGGRKEELIFNVCQKYGATTYLSGMGGKTYMTDAHFDALAERNIGCRFVDRDLTAAYPYSTVHYLLTAGSDAVRQIVAGENVNVPL